MSSPDPVLREQCDGYVREWHCDPPPLGTRFLVHPGDDEWTVEDEVPVRRIYRAEVVA